MRSLAPKARKEESEFDDLLGQLVDELAMTPASESAVSFTPEVPVAPAHVDSTQALAAEAAAAAQARAAAAHPPVNTNSNNAVKIAGIFAAAFSTVAIAALFMFSQQESTGASEDSVAQPSEPAAPEPKVELPPAPAPAPAPVVVAPVPTPEPVVVAPPVEPVKVDKPKPRKRVDKPKVDKPKPSTDDEFDVL